ncbi:MAG: aromatic ring-hydroxylating dioxygenase subunit alpha [Acidimicrobiales bacterium]|jgi:phenylpropionate dioxygenase-like ring-hydroxylating dioxygenase large terminal subunit|nr:aromatic ring-hydroxylating dioxygenase subunit alpha [Acidimicrobiales bacterium]
MTEQRRGLDGDWYTDPGTFAEELDRIFTRTWQLVGHAGQLRNAGDYLTATIGDQGIVVNRLADGSLHAMYNVCQHRGHELVVGDTGSAQSITCPYHAWTYDLDGRLLHARGEQVGEVCVPPVRLEQLAGFLWVNLDDAAPSLADTVPGIEEELLAVAPTAPGRTLTHRRTHLCHANWKIAVENYNECYHCPNVHKAFTRGVVSPDSYRIASRGQAIRHSATAPATTGYALAGGGEPYESFFVFPVSSIQCYPGEVLNTFRWVPLAVDRTLLVREWWFDADEPTDEQREIIDLDWDTTVSEDFDLMDSVQRGMRSRGYTPGPLIESTDGVATVHSEDTVPHLHDLVRTALGR